MTTITAAGVVTEWVGRLREPFRRPVIAWPATALVVVLVSIATIVLRRRVRSPLGLSAYDGQLHVRQARFLDAGSWLGPYDNLTLVKVPGYSLFISGCNRLGLAVKDGEQLVALVAALLVAVCVLVTTKRLSWSLPAFVVCAFDPIFLSSWSADFGRDALFASITVIVVTTLFLTGYFLVFGRALGWSLVTALLAGLSLAAYLLTREEGVTVVPLAAVAIGAVPLWHVLRTRGWRAGWQRAGRAALRLVPAVLVLCLAAALPVASVGAENQKEYGVATASELAGGPFMDAYAQWQRVEAGPTLFRIPISEPQRRVVYPVSPTARQLQASLEDPANQWRASGCTTPPDCDYAGGWMTWAMRDAAAAAGAFGSAPEAAAFWAQLAQEIADACDAGELTCRMKLPSALQPVQRITGMDFLGSVERLTGSLLSSKDQYLQPNTMPTARPEQRAEFVAVDSGIPATAAGAARQLADYDVHEWQYQVLSLTYTLLVPVGAALGLVLMVVLVATRRGRRAVGPLAVLAVALLLGAALRVALISVVDAADYDADQPRYLYPAHSLLLAFAVVALVEGLRHLDLRQLGALVRGPQVPVGERATDAGEEDGDEVDPAAVTMPLYSGEVGRPDRAPRPPVPGRPPPPGAASPDREAADRHPG